MRAEKWRELRRYIDEFRIVKEEPLEESNKFLSIKGTRFRLNNGEELIREEYLAKGEPCSASIILPITKSNDIILTVQPRPFLPGGVGIELPAGIIERGENPIITARRELQEETGYRPKRLKGIATFSQSHGMSRGVDHGYIAYDCERVSKQKLDSDEFIRLFLCSFQDVLVLIEKGYIKDANSQLVVEKAKRYIKER